ncbi:MAG: hypothetical protein M9965_00835 [Anaerolineae bacterium]|nr:hypothetical protein [Anaerolineae bacterium]
MITPDKTVRTTCPYCGVGCQLDLNVKDGYIYRVLLIFCQHDIAPVEEHFQTTTSNITRVKTLIRMNRDGVNRPNGASDVDSARSGMNQL